MRAIQVFITLLGALWIGLVTAAVVFAESPPLTLSVTPDAVVLAPGEAAQDIVTAKISITTVQSITLTAFADATVDVTINAPERTRPPLRGDVVWTVTITRSNTGRPAGKVYFRADYQMKESDGQLVPGVTTAPLDIQERIPDTIDKVVTANLETALETLQDQQSRQVFVVVKNISNVPVTVTHIKVWPIPRITTAVEELGTGFRLEPQQSNPFSMTLTAGDAVQSGKHLLIVRVDIEWEKAGQRTTGSLVLDKDFTVGVFGESAILQVTTIPSVMFLPGFLFVTTLVLLVKWSWHKPLLDLDFKKPEFWFVAVTISLIAILLYPLLTGPFLSFLLRRPMSSRDYLQGYGFNDILLLWLGAVLLGLFVWVAGSTTVWLGLKGRNALVVFRAWRERTRRTALVPSEDDSPLVILRKIANNQKGFDLRQVKYPGGDASQYVFVLPSGFPEPGKIWVVPRIRLQWRKATDRFKDEFDVLKSNEQDTRTLIRTLERWLDPRDPVVELDWDRSGAHIRQPKLVEQNQTEGLVNREPFIASA